MGISVAGFGTASPPEVGDVQRSPMPTTRVRVEVLNAGGITGLARDATEYLRDSGFVNAMAAAGGGLQLTMDTADIHDWKIDHIYLSSGLGSRLTSAAIIRDVGFRTDPPRPEGVWDHSDHLPVQADLDWP